MRIENLFRAASLSAVTLGMALIVTPLSRAQLPPPNPLVAPVPAPSAPADLQAPAQPDSVPSLDPMPQVAAAPPTPAVRNFTCSCYGPTTGTSWTGQISASGFFAARQAATGACLTYNQGRQTAPPVISTYQTNQFAPAATLPQGFENPNAASTLGTTKPGALNFSTRAQQLACSQCACN